jgi:hypothetical protein
LPSSFTSEIEDIEVAVRFGLVVVVAGLMAEGGLVVAERLGLEDTTGFLTPSETDARGRFADTDLREAVEPVGETTFAREVRLTVADADTLELVEDDNAVVTGALGTIDALLLGIACVSAAPVVAEVLVGAIVGLDEGTADALTDFFIGEAADVAAATCLGAVGFTEPEPNVPELIIYYFTCEHQLRRMHKTHSTQPF